jgi:hypothetical protein
MLVLGIAVAIALVLPLVTGGSYARLVMTGWRWAPLLFVGLFLQLLLEYLPIPESRYDDVGFGLLALSYVCILTFCAANVLLRGMTIVLIGVACNALVIFVNQGMPVDVPPSWAAETWVEPTIKHHPQEPDDKLMFLGDIIVLNEPFSAVISFGDLILAVGLCDVTYWASRKPKRAPHPVVPPDEEAAGPAPEPKPELTLPDFRRGRGKSPVDLSVFTDPKRASVD